MPKQMSKDQMQEQIIRKLLRVVAIATNKPNLFYERNAQGHYNLFHPERDEVDDTTRFAEPFGYGARTPANTEMFLRGIIIGMTLTQPELMRQAWKGVQE